MIDSNAKLRSIQMPFCSEKSHGREETRLHIVCDVPDELIDFTFE